MSGEPKTSRRDEPLMATTQELLAELGRRFRLRYGRLEAVFHDGKPSPRVLVEHRMLRDLDDT
jgi:hypothetical protein